MSVLCMPSYATLETDGVCTSVEVAPCVKLDQRGQRRVVDVAGLGELQGVNNGFSGHQGKSFRLLWMEAGRRQPYAWPIGRTH